MSSYIKLGLEKAPTVLGAGILGIAAAGLVTATWGVALPLAGELTAAAVAMIAAGKYA